jgi:hypothetical protein
MKKIVFASWFVCMTVTAFSQSISSSPYSLYGLGSLYDSNFGSINSYGSSGIALPSSRFINNLNPASLGFMYQNHFLFDVGGKSIFTTYENSAKKESRNNMQFSHIAFAFPVGETSALSVALKPYSSAAYKISNLELSILDSQENYILNASGSGGLNNFDVSYGYRIGKSIALGLSTSFLFGNTTDEREYAVANSLTNISKETSYKGVRFSLGSQIKVDSTFTIGTNVKSPSRINATKVQSVTTVNNSGTTAIETDVASDTDDFYFPLEIGVGLSKVFKNNLNVTVDYGKSLWTDARQSDLYGNFVNQDKFSLGFSYSKTKRIRTYFDRIQYGAGLNYDTGYLEVDNKKINSMSLSLGVTLPLENNFSALNISYSFGQNGKISNGFIKENFHKISLNLSLDGIWFVKRKYD